MFRPTRPFLALALLASSFALGTTAAPTTPVVAADAPWTLPTVPPYCTTAQADSGDVAGCVIRAGSGLPESRGWPQPPFPEPTGQTVVAWVNLSIGTSGPTVAKVQEALNNSGYSVIADGKFGALTFNAVKAYQAANGLTATGTVDAATAAALHVQRMTGGTFPPAGWVWKGWGYNGSPALAAWEQLLVGNPMPIGSLRVGQLKALPDALPLFVGFYNEIQARGYKVNDGGPYVFRCTASTSKDCKGLTRYALSNHAYGLAQDINTALNPMVAYYSSGTTSACAVPMKTDMPRWVIQVAEKWGLYWGGYAWSSGCASPSTWRTKVTRDPMHFEFNGSPAQARAILKKASSLPCVDQVDEAGAVSVHCLTKGELPAANSRVAVTTAPPTGATAALVQLFTSGATTPGTLTAEDCAARPNGPRATTTLAVRAGQGSSTLAVVPLDAQHRFCLYQTSAFNTVATVQGWLAPAAAAPTGLRYTPIDPARTIDTAVQTACSPTSTCLPAGPVPAGTELMSTVASHTTPVAVLTTLTVAGPTVSGSLVAGSCSNQATGAIVRSGTTFAARDAATTMVGFVRTFATELGNQFCTTASQTATQSVEVTGLFAPAATGDLGFSTPAATRVLDTTQCWRDPFTNLDRCGTIIGKGGMARAVAPAGAAAVMLQVSGTGATGSVGAMQVAACEVFYPKPTTPPAPAAQVQVGSGVTNSNLVVVPLLASGRYCVKTSAAAHITIDLVGTLSASADGRLLPITPKRVLDTRPRA